MKIRVMRKIYQLARAGWSCKATNESFGKRRKESGTGPSSLSRTDWKKNDLLHLVHGREVFKYHGLTRFGNLSRNFKQRCLEAYACSPRVWEYAGTNKRADGALEYLPLNLQTDEGEVRASTILLGGSNGRLSACASTSSTADQQNDSVLITPRQCLPSDRKLWSGEEKPFILKHISDNTIFSSKITAIKKLGKILDAGSSQPCQRAIIATLGSAESGGTLYLMRLNSESRDSHMMHARSGVNMRVSASVITNCSVWTAECSAQGTMACLGTSKGAGLVALETGSLKWICRSKSDLLSLQFENTGNVVLCGFRNGFISTVDVRAPPQRLHQQVSTAVSHGRNLDVPTRPRFWNPFRQREVAIGTFTGENFETMSIDDENITEKATLGIVDKDSSEMRMKSALCSIVLLPSDERYFLASAMDGTICLWDRRMSHKGVVRNYEGLFNSHTNLGLGVDPSETLLLSGGEDCTICIWSIASGRLLHKKSGLSSPANTVCWPTSYDSNTSFQWNGLMEPLPKDKHAWGVFLGSFDGLLYMHGGAS
ncbi:hypothetical protein O6H91_04G136400 [Diphasiastrum complanatum]|uniref:Uncharacterized protein n=1 Tax=Diphasiastrum complanatum TaxID=34168 RepID=A0ACC2E299_DIPCM|nr:hypothetical protein O6H91_04G136400 [Diphasiastrum complanatum]